MLVRVTENCPWNRCEFCSVFKGQKFRIRPIEDVKEGILAARKLVEDMYRWSERSGYTVSHVAQLNGILWLQNDGVRSAFLQDSDSMIMKTEPLADILEFLCGVFPTLERVCTYARAKTVYRKKLGELKRLRDAGLSRLHIGLETGDDELLAYIQKGVTAAEQIQAGRKAVEAGFEVSEYVMPGLGGRERWEQHALNSARVLNEVNPRFIRLRTFHPATGTPIYEKARREEYHVQSIEGVLKEVRVFVDALDVTSELITSDFSWNFYLGEVDGKLPEEKEKVLAEIDRALAHWQVEGEPRRNPFMGKLNLELN
jgi:radical SAM superfamily enzyme YgiQ (UPF0313 family)